MGCNPCCPLDPEVIHQTGIKHSGPNPWEKHGKAAGPIRNQFMLEQEKPDLVIAFDGGRGTADMMRRSRRAGVDTIHIEA